MVNYIAKLSVKKNINDNFIWSKRERQINTTKLNMIYEADLPFYNPNFQKMVYNEGSGL